MQKFILQLSSCCFLELFCDCAGQTYMFPAKDASQLKMLYGYPDGKYCQYCLRGACVTKQKKKKTDLMNLL